MPSVRGNETLRLVSVEASFESNRFPITTPDCKAEIGQSGNTGQDIRGRFAFSPYDLILNPVKTGVSLEQSGYLVPAPLAPVY